MFDKIFKEVKYLENHSVEIGILGIDRDKKGKTKKGKDTKATIIEYAFYNEFGTKNIPARPFMRHAIDSNKNVLANLTKEVSAEVIRGEITGKKALMRIGETIRGMIVESISNAEEWAKPLEISTIINKSDLKNNGTLRDKPLVDKGFLIKYIRYQIVDKKGNPEYISEFEEV